MSRAVAQPRVSVEPEQSGAGGSFLSAHDVYKTYRLERVDVPVLRGVTLRVTRGEWVAILGASGSGKSTLLHLLGGLDRPDRTLGASRCEKCGYELCGVRGERCPECGGPVRLGGTVVYEGKPLARMSKGAIDRYRNVSVGFVFQFYHLLPELTVLENALIPAMVRWGRFGYARRARETRERAAELLGTFGLSHRLKHRPAELSGGERQRVAIARALINDPSVLLADEPTGNLDRKTGDAILDAVAAHRKQTGRTLVMVTHDIEVAARADRIVRLVDGRIAADEASKVGGESARSA